MKLARIDIDSDSLASPSPEVEHERQVAMFDLIEKNSFKPEGGSAEKYDLRLAYEDGRLVFDVSGEGYAKKIMLSFTPLKPIMKDYAMICESYYEALKNATVGQIESIDMGRRGIHNDGAELLTERLAGKIEIDHETARRLFTLIHALHLRG
ncbi:UPF0262 family protein [Asticcacaulis excentricus]|uniref:Uncharacterized conserved protein UCP032146 n=1 Tax=Asticcacaulis excentricus (strain ATCC 15261 / DSM 4724 / KCTC 12464 / NCIMB 9791 / VKM B-1370 / CB 48) TaxID=573065 RepID=E8RN33_ASTEC|nr:UPF0262 family protein [Asticcacaulis excentricus]ADU12866.1 Uncharacterized conserved protein UCP032146 [Asticcacaulis excentricus CB 48]